MLRYSINFPSRWVVVLSSVSITFAFLLSVWIGTAQADPANAELVVEGIADSVRPGDTLSVTVTLKTLDAEDAFDFWGVELAYNPEALELDKVWANDAILPAEPALDPFVTRGEDWVFFGDGTFDAESSGSAPFLLATLNFTITQTDAWNVRVLSDTEFIENSTSFGNTGIYWYPGKVTVTVSAEYAVYLPVVLRSQ